MCRWFSHVWLKVHPKCIHTIADFEGTTFVEGGNEIDKKSDPTLSHLSDAVGYCVYALYPPGGVVISRQM